jgi:FtsZ-binding cell division protein ZapB
MNTSIVKTPPEGIFEEVSIEVEGWQDRFKELIGKRQKIQFNVYTMPNLSMEIQTALDRQRYVDLIFESDKDQHFLVPLGN